jgi:sulfonate transport system permease protein
MLTRVVWAMLSVAVGFALVGVWQLAANLQLISPVFFPGPDRAWAALLAGLQSGELGPNIAATLQRMFYGWFVASVAAVALGALIGVSATARAYLGPTLEFIRPLPASAIVPLTIALVGLSDVMVLIVITFGAVWPILLATVHGFAAVEPRLYEVSRALRLSRWEVITKIALPSAMPDILAGMRIGLTVSLILTVVGEMLASRDGLGMWILLAARSFRSADLFAGVILLGLIGYASAQILALAERRLLRWRV